MRVLNDFRCDASGQITEKFLDREVTHAICQCGATSQKLIRPIRSVLETTSGDFPGATGKWLKHREKTMDKERKHLDSHGTEYLKE